MTPQELREATPLISTSPNYAKYLAAKAKRERRESIVSRLLSPVTAVGVFAHAYAETFAEVMSPSGGHDIYFGPGK